MYTYNGLTEPKNRAFWTPAALGGNLMLWLDGRDSPFVTRSGGGEHYVEEWGDLSGNNHNVGQTSVNSQPVLGESSVQFDGAPEYLKGPFTFSSTVDPSATYTVVGSLENFTNPPTIFELDSGNTRNILQFRDTEGFVYYDGNNRFSNLTVGPNELFVATVRSSQASKRLSVNGQTVTFPGTSNIRQSGTLWVGDDSTRGNDIKGEVYAILAYSSFLSDADHAKVEGWAAHKFGFASGLPNAHPYRHAAPRVDLWQPKTDSSVFWLSAKGRLKMNGAGRVEEAGEGVVAAQTTDSDKPEYQKDAISGYPTLYFDDTSYYLDFGTQVTVQTARDATIVTLYEKLHGNRNKYESLVRVDNTGGGTNDGIMLLTDLKAYDSWGTWHGPQVSAGASLVNQGPSLLTMSGQEGNFRTDGGYTGSWSQSWVRAREAGFISRGFNQWLDGNLSELIVFSENGSSFVAEVAEGFIAHSYGIQDQLPSSHPYRYFPPHDGQLEEGIKAIIGSTGHWWDWEVGVFNGAGTEASVGEEVKSWTDRQNGATLTTPLGNGPSLTNQSLYFNQSVSQGLIANWMFPSDVTFTTVSSGLTRTPTSDLQNGLTVSQVASNANLIGTISTGQTNNNGYPHAAMNGGTYDTAEHSIVDAEGLPFVHAAAFNQDSVTSYYEEYTTSLTQNSGISSMNLDTFAVGCLMRNGGFAGSYISNFRHVLVADRELNSSEVSLLRNLLLRLDAYRMAGG